MATATNKRPAPAKSPALKVAPKARPDSDDDDLDEGDDDEASGGKEKLALAKRTAVRLGNSVNRIIKIADKVANWTTDSDEHVLKAQGALTVAVEALKAACEGLTALPDDYKSRAPKVKGAKNGKGGKVELLPGSFVRITDKAKGEYEGLDFALTGIEVIEVRGNKVVCKTNDGMKAMFARGHVCPDVG